MHTLEGEESEDAIGDIAETGGLGLACVVPTVEGSSLLRIVRERT